MELAAEANKEGAVALCSRFFDKSIASIVAAICSYIDPSYVSTVAYATELNILAQTGSPTAAEFARQALCGGVAPSTINDHLFKLVEKSSQEKLSFPSSGNLIVADDNNSTNYKGSKTARGGTSVLNRPMNDLDEHGGLHLLVPI
jgi:hypothetical protein